MTEFTSADGIFRSRDPSASAICTFYEDEHPISAQLFGSDPDTLADAARIVEDAWLRPGGSESRMSGQESREVQWRLRPAADLPAIGTIFEAVRAAVKIPFTVKFRAGLE